LAFGVVITDQGRSAESCVDDGLVAAIIERLCGFRSRL